jgi:hypothetical protein
LLANAFGIQFTIHHDLASFVAAACLIKRRLRELVRRYGDTAQKLARCIVPTTPVPAGHSLTFVLDVTAAQQGEHVLRAYFQSLKYTSTTEGYIRELLETLALLP